jgi:hypothetical protein
MKHPVLKIKKGAVIYDDSDAQRSAELPHAALPGSGPFVSRRRRRRSGSFTFIPLLVVALGLFMLFRVIPHTPIRQTVLSGWQIILRVTPYQGILIVGVTFISHAHPTQRAPQAPYATVHITIPGTGQQELVAGVLEKSPMTLRVELVRAKEPRTVEAEVSIAGAHARLRLPAPY